MSFIKGKEHLQKHGLADRIMEFNTSSATVAEAAAAIGCREEEIVKTLSFMVEDKPILIAAAGDAKIDNGKFKAEFHTKAKMLPHESVESLVGHAVGGVCPFGINEGVAVYLDASVKRLSVLYPACGSSRSAVRLTLEELEAASRFEKWVNVCKEPQL